MGSRLKEDEKNEKIIRSLLKQAPNRRCINCNSLGPQYVCLNFWTFVCTQCSGIHREFTHRVKSVSMSKFTSQEVTSLQNGGNERAREIHFKDWDRQRQPLPDSNNVDRLRDFIKSVYVDKRFSGERPLPRARGGDREEVYESRRPEPRSNYSEPRTNYSEPRSNYRADSRSPPYEDRYEERQPGPRRSDVGYDDRRYEERPGRFDEKRSPGRFETDRSRYDRNYNDNRRYEDRGRYENRDRHYDDRLNEGLDRRFEERFMNERRNPQHNRDYGGGSPPPVRPVKEILGDDVPPLRVEDHGSHTNGGREGDKSNRSQDARGQRFGSSSSFGSVDGNVPVVKRESSGSLIDFTAEPEAPASREQPDPFGLTSAVQPTASTSSSSGWATFDMFPSVAGAPAAPAAPSGVSGGFNDLTTQLNGSGQWSTQWLNIQTASGPPPVESSTDSWSSLVGPASQPPISAAGSQPWSPFATSTAPVPAKPLPAASPQTVQELQSATLSVAGTQAVPVPNKSRQPIPEDFFTPSFPDRNMQNMGLHTGMHLTGAPPLGPQFAPLGVVGMPGQMSNYSQPPKSKNPFDLPGDSQSGSMGGEFPNMSSVQAALPSMNMGPMSVRGPGLGGFGPQWPQPSMMVSQPASYPSAVPSGGGMFIGQQMPNALPPTMRAGPMGPVGVGISGGVLSAPKQGADSFFPVQGAPQLPSQNAFGAMGSDSLYTLQGGPRMPFQNSVGPANVSAVSSDSMFSAQTGQRLLSQNSMGPAVGSAVSSDSVFSAQTGQRLLSQSSLGSLGNMPGSDSLFPVQAVPQFPPQNSLGPVGNPFG